MPSPLLIYAPLLPLIDTLPAPMISPPRCFAVSMLRDYSHADYCRLRCRFVSLLRLPILLCRHAELPLFTPCATLICAHTRDIDMPPCSAF